VLDCVRFKNEQKSFRIKSERSVQGSQRYDGCQRKLDLLQEMAAVSGALRGPE
jgi:hypothetical protein